MIARRFALGLALFVCGCAAPGGTSAPAAAPAPIPAEKQTISPPSTATPALAPSTGTGTTSSDAAPSNATGTSPPNVGTIPPTPEPTPIDDVPHAQAQFEASAQIFTSSGSDCTKMCKALASMQRAADHLCDLVKNAAVTDKKKCTDAKARVDHARDKVLSACGGCD